MAEEQAPTITRDQAREALLRVEEAVKAVTPAIEAAPHGLARAAERALDALHGSVACELGLKILGTCEGCSALVCDGDDHILTTDGCWLCTECRPSDEDLARIRAIQAACPKGDPDCEAQTEDNDHRRCGSQTSAHETVTDKEQG